MSIFTANEIRDYFITKGILAIQEILSNPTTFAATWTPSGDFAVAGSAAVYTDSANSGGLTQASGDFTYPEVLNEWYRFDYTVSGSTGVCAATITTAFAAVAQTLDLTDGAHSIYFKSHATVITAFTIAATSTSGGFTLDNFSLSIFEGGTIVDATHLQTYVLRVEAAMPSAFVAKDPRIIRGLESVERTIMSVAAGIYGMALTHAGIVTWIHANRPELDNIADFLAYVLIEDLAINVAEISAVDQHRDMPLGSSLTQVVPGLSAEQYYLDFIYKILTDVTQLMRHFATLAQLDANGIVVLTGLQDIF
jgi:hypothetical protein